MSRRGPSGWVARDTDAQPWWQTSIGQCGSAQDRRKMRRRGCTRSIRETMRGQWRWVSSERGWPALWEEAERTPARCSLKHCPIEHGRARPIEDAQGHGCVWNGSIIGRGGSWRGGLRRLAHLRNESCQRRARVKESGRGGASL
jgi:hypothetical protein